MPTEPKVIAVIPARWASSRFPGKPLAIILGKPMIQWVVQQAEKCPSVSEVLVATDDQRIFDAVRGFGGQVVMTSGDHPSGTDRVAEAAAGLDCDIVVNVQGDEPLIPPENIDLVVQPLLKDPQAEVYTLVMKIGRTEDMFNPNVTKVVLNGQGCALYFSRAPIPYDRDGWAEATPAPNTEPPRTTVLYGWKHIGLYAYTKSFLMQFNGLHGSRLETIEKLEQLRILDNGGTIRAVETDRNSIGVDREEDIPIVEEILRALQP
ncbi:MAG: 3-deoxy-manno-octulosonate cytidylyltransferase [Nitrospinaceae bacterium]